jgi:ABC-type Mn2+/Zn2+ transport system permease subunit
MAGGIVRAVSIERAAGERRSRGVIEHSRVLLQALLRNPLASPFVLGVSSGAGLGVTLSMYLGGTLGITLLEGDSNVVAALLGALLVLVIVHWLGRRHGVLDPLSLLLVGVIVAAMCGAIVMFLQRLVAGGLRGEMMLWMMGRIPQAVSNELLFTIGAITIAGLIVSTMMGRAMDVASLGEDEAQSVGLSLGRTRLGLFGIAGALTAGAVAVAGPIGFVGLIGPHLARLLIGARTRVAGARERDVRGDDRDRGRCGEPGDRRGCGTAAGGRVHRAVGRAGVHLAAAQDGRAAAMIEVRGLSHSYGEVEALIDISVRADAGQGERDHRAECVGQVDAAAVHHRSAATGAGRSASQRHGH